jgi:putative transposase
MNQLCDAGLLTPAHPFAAPMDPTDKSHPLEPSWEVSDWLWQQIEPILLEDAPPKPTGRKRSDWRRILNGILFRMRSGCQWSRLPREFGDDSTVHRWYQRWCRNGVMARIWPTLIETYPELANASCEWKGVEQSEFKAPSAQGSTDQNCASLEAQ